MATITSSAIPHTSSLRHEIEILGSLHTDESSHRSFGCSFRIKDTFSYVKPITSKEERFVRAIWNGHLEDIEKSLVKTPSLLHQQFKVRIVSQFCMESQINPVIMLGSVMHIVCFTIHTSVLRLLFSHHSTILIDTSLSFYENSNHFPDYQLTLDLPLFTVIKYIDDTANHDVMIDLLRYIPEMIDSLSVDFAHFSSQFDLPQHVEEELRPSGTRIKFLDEMIVKNIEVPMITQTIAKMITVAKYRMLESYLFLLSYSELFEVRDILTQPEGIFPAAVFKLILDYVRYIPNTKIAEILNTRAKEDSNSENTPSDHLTFYPLGRAFSLLKNKELSPEFKHRMIILIQTLLEAGAKLDLQHDVISIRNKYTSDFPPDFFDCLSVNRNNSTTLVKKLIKFQEKQTNTCCSIL